MAQKVVVDFELKYKEAVKNLDEFQKEYSKLEKEVVSANKKTADSIKQVEKGASDGAKGIKKVGISIKNLAKASGIIFLLQKAFEFVSGAIQENQQVMNGLNVVFETAQIVFNQVLNAIVDIYNSVTKTSENFDALGKVLSGLLTLSLTPIKFTFYAIKLAIQEAMLAWEDSFFGGKDADKIKQLNIEILETKSNIVEVAESASAAGKDIVDNFSEATSELGAIGETVAKELSEVSIKTALETAKSNIALKKSAEIAVAQSRIILEQKDREAEKLRQVRDEERNSIADRIKANNDLNKVLDEQEKEMLKNADIVLAAAQAQFNLTGKNEDYVRVLEAQAEKEGVLAQIEGFRSEQKSNDLALSKEELELGNAQLESETNLSIERKRFNAEQIQDNLARLEAQKLIDEEEKVLQEARLQAIVNEATAGTQAKVDAQIALDEFMAQSGEQSVERDKEISDAKIEISKKEAQVKKDNLDKTANVLQSFSAIAGEETVAGKAFAVAAATINTYRGVSDALAAVTVTPFETALKFANAAAIGVAGIANVKKIISVKVPNASGGGQAAPSSASIGEAPPIPPAFNIVGQSDTNQLADAIGGQTQQPIQAFVVSSEVTTAQELDRNIIDGASIG